MILLSEDQPKKKRTWIKRDVSPGFQKFVNVVAYGMGRASALLKSEKSKFNEAHKQENEEIKAHNLKNPDKRKARKRLGISTSLWLWFKGFTKGVDMRMKEYKAEKKPDLAPVPATEDNVRGS